MPLGRITILPALLALFAAFSIPSAAAAAELSGKPHAIDGDTMEIAGRIVRLYGIDAPDPGETCANGGRPWNCGDEAAFALAFEMAEHWIGCDVQAEAPDGAAIASCRIGPYDLSARMVGKGWARAVAPEYAGDETTARNAGRGIWAVR